MTDGNFSDGDLVDGHLTDEQLSSHLDGASDTDRGESEGERAGQHLAACAQCRDRLATFEAGRLLVRTPIPPVAPEVRAASIASVLRAAEVAQGDSRAHGNVRAHSDAGDAPIPMRAPRRPGVLVGSAAAVLVLAVAVGIPLALSRGTSSGTAASSSASTSSAAAAPSGPTHQQASGTNRLSQNDSARTADLGAVGSVAALRSRVTALLAADKVAAPPSPVPGSGAAVPTTTGGPVTTVPAATATTATTATSISAAGTASRGTFNTEANAATTRQFEICLSSAMHAAGTKRSVHLLATAEFKGMQALVYVFLPVTGGPATGNAAHSMAVATARDGCRVLGTTTL